MTRPSRPGSTVSIDTVKPFRAISAQLAVPSIYTDRDKAAALVPVVQLFSFLDEKRDTILLHAAQQNNLISFVASHE